MPLRDESAFRHERAAFDRDMAAARAALEAGDVDAAVDLAISPSHKFWYGKDPSRFELLSDLHELVSRPVEESSYRANPWQAKLLAELYSVWPKLDLEGAFLKHNFLGPHVDEQTVSAAESVQLAEYTPALSRGMPVALSRGRWWVKLWEVETGKVIRTEPSGLTLLASTLGRDASHVLFAGSWIHPKTKELCWATSFRETFRRVSCLHAGTYEKSHFENVRYYPLTGEIVQMVRVRRDSDDYLHEVTISHDEIEGYLPAGTNTFLARSNNYYGLKVEDLRYNDRVSAVLAVEDDERWLSTINGSGHGLKGIYNEPTTPVTSLCISSDGSLGMANGEDDSFGLWNLWTGARLREFRGHTGRVTCLCLSVDASFAVSGSDDRTVRLWKPISAECVRVFEGHEEGVTKVCISLDATKILSADRGGVIKLWDRETGQCLRTIRAHEQSVSGLLITPDGRFAASCSWDKTVRLWRLGDGACMKTFEHDDWVTAVDMTPDGRYLVSSGYDATKVWELIWTLEPRDVADWDEGARPYLEILLNANAAWEGKLGTPVDMTEEEKRDALRRHSPTWHAWHDPSQKEDWYRVWHLSWDIEETLGHAGYGWLSEGPGRECGKIMDEWKREHARPET